jgi:hypothetical protein
MGQVVWLILSIGGPSMHVGNFPNIDTCLTAAKQVAQGGTSKSVSYLAFCVPANTGKQGDPPPPQ